MNTRHQPANQGLLMGLTLVGHAEAASGRQVVVASTVRDVAITSAAAKT
jgi:hypothetical protein